MSKNLVIVESPAKAKTLEKYLGNDFFVLASYGHVRDLIPKKDAVDTRDFSMKYEPIAKNIKHMEAIYKSMKTSDTLYLATDPDREGEAISWHIKQMIEEKKLLGNKIIHRVAFHEVTKSAILEAMKNPRDISMDLVNAQQTRRALDYLVGFNLSPLLWKKIKPGLSAGRVQSPALRLIVEREQEIEAFKSKEYWTIEADLSKSGQQFNAKLINYENKKLNQFSIVNEAQAAGIKKTIDQAAAGRLNVSAIEKKKQKRYPSPPFTTSTLQQEAARKLGFRPRYTMRIAQQLYEGVEIGSETVGLITYMRTDSLNLSNEALAEIRNQIKNLFGDDKLPAKANYYKTKSKNAQEAHEAIRPTSVLRQPFNIEKYLSKDQFKLYSMIWRRAMACQMTPAIVNMVSVDLGCSGGHIFRATGSSIEELGFYRVYHETDDDAQMEIEENLLPELKEKDTVQLEAIRPEQHFTKPPPRFTEASLVRSLEQYGIGRPSTYAQIISTLLDREYVELDKKRFIPTDIGRIVTRFLSDHFERYMDYEFTARMEDNLDAISRGEKEWIPLMEHFWKKFKEQIDIKTEVSRQEVVQDRILGEDPASGRKVIVRLGRFGPMAQIGTREETEKPRFARIPSGKSLETITLSEALDLFKLPRELGMTPEGEKVLANVGRYGPYIQYDKKFVSIKNDDPYTITLERALELIAEKKHADANKTIKSFQDESIQILNGRYGPYVTDGKTNGRIPKHLEPEALTLEECREILEQSKNKPSRIRRRKKS